MEGQGRGGAGGLPGFQGSSPGPKLNASSFDTSPSQRRSACCWKGGCRRPPTSHWTILIRAAPAWSLLPDPHLSSWPGTPHQPSKPGSGRRCQRRPDASKLFWPGLGSTQSASQRERRARLDREPYKLDPTPRPRPTAGKHRFPQRVSMSLCQDFGRQPVSERNASHVGFHSIPFHSFLPSTIPSKTLHENPTPQTRDSLSLSRQSIQKLEPVAMRSNGDAQLIRCRVTFDSTPCG